MCACGCERVSARPKLLDLHFHNGSRARHYVTAYDALSFPGKVDYDT